MRILVVETSTEDRSTLAVALGEDAYSAAFADDAALVLQQIARGPPHLTIAEMPPPRADRRASCGEERPLSALGYRRQRDRRSLG